MDGSKTIYIYEVVPYIHLKEAQNILPQYRWKALLHDDCGVKLQQLFYFLTPLELWSKHLSLKRLPATY